MADESQKVDFRITITPELLRYLKSLDLTESEILGLLQGTLSDADASRIADLIDADNEATIQ